MVPVNQKISLEDREVGETDIDNQDDDQKR
jgi:hypothetical protein